MKMVINLSMPFKYLLSLLVPNSCIFGLYYGGWAAPSTLVLAFGVAPLLELIIPIRHETITDEEMQHRLSNPWFDRLLYFHVVCVWGVAIYFIYLLATKDWTTWDHFFAIITTGILFGVGGINVAHELGHRQDKFDIWMSRFALFPVLFSHYTIEHNYGHHVKVGTPEDPATARMGESLYAFFFRATLHTYLDAWKIGNNQIKKQQKGFLEHPLVMPTLLQLLFLAGILRYAGKMAVVYYVCACVMGWFALQCVNYIEHYGLFRKKLPSGRYETQTTEHSWNSDHELGRILLFELVRHPDHHAHTSKTYPELVSRPESPQLPFGYPMSILIAMVPPLWFSIMNPRIKSRNLSLPLTVQ